MTTLRHKKIGPFINRNLSGWLLMLFPVAAFFIVVWRPIIIGISYSFFHMTGFTIDGFAGLRNYQDVLTDTNFLSTLKNTVGYVGWSLIIGLPLPFIAAVILNEMVHGKTFFKFATYLPVVVPSVAVSLIWKTIYMDGSGGLLNMLLQWAGAAPVQWLSNPDIVILLIVISMTWQGFGGTLIIYLATLQSVNQDLYEAARIDGAGFFRRIRCVLMPHMWPLILLMTIRQIIAVFQVVEQPMVMTGGGPNGASMSLGLTNYYYAFKFGQFSKSMALGVIMFLMMLIFTVIYFKLDRKFAE